MMNRIVLFLLLGAVPAAAANFNPYLGQILDIREGRQAVWTGKPETLLKSLSLGTVLPADVFVFGRGDANSLLKYGARVQTRAGRYFTAFVRTDSLSALKNETAVDFLNYNPFVERHNDLARTYVDAHQTAAAGYRGDDVIVGVVDTGIDVNHPDFKTENGLSRILFLWDQTDPTGTSPYGFDYGREWNKGEIDMGLCTEVDEGYHGTHVSGIAAGNGSASDGTWKGVSPGATIVFVKLNFDNIGYVLDAVSYIFYKARLYQKPCVVNLSLGTHSGSHTEFDDFNEAMDAVVDYYGGTGRIVVWSAGNSGADPMHKTLSMPADTTNSLSLNYGNGTVMYMEYWYNYSNLTFTVLQPGGGTNVPWTNTAQFTTYQNSDLRIESGANGAGEKYLTVNLQSATKGGVWQIVFADRPDAVTVDGYVVNYSALNRPNNYFPSSDASGTLSNPACEKKALAVGAMVTRVSYTNSLGTIYTSPSSLYDIADYSSIGPSRNGRNKPDVAAPGTYVISTLANTPGSFPPPEWKVNEYYAAIEGTSMAAPMVTGIVAQILEKEPTLDAEGVRIRLNANTKTNSYKPNRFWNNTFGYGIADLAFLLTTAPVVTNINVILKNNVLNVTETKDNKMIILFRSNAQQVGRPVRAQVFDRNGSLIMDSGEYRIQSVEVKEYVWNGKDQFGRTVQPGIYFLVVSVDTASTRYPVLVVR